MALTHYLYIIGLIATSGIRYSITRKRSRPTSSNFYPIDLILTTIAGIAMFVLPIIYIFTPWLKQYDYTLPPWIRVVGSILFTLAIILLWVSHRAFGPNWHPTIETGASHRLITHSVYKRIRNPMYAAHLPWALAQPMLLSNRVAGWSLLLVSIPLYMYRIPRGKKLLQARFGFVYMKYLWQAGCLWPRSDRMRSH